MVVVVVSVLDDNWMFIQFLRPPRPWAAFLQGQGMGDGAARRRPALRCAAGPMASPRARCTGRSLQRKTAMNTSDLRESVRDVIAYDDARESAPFEHACTLITGLGLIACALLTPSRGRAVIHAMAGGALLVRAASGRDGLRKWAREPQAQPRSRIVVAP